MNNVRQSSETVLCAGHSLGGAVALLCCLLLLRSMPDKCQGLQCVCFGTPAVGNQALTEVVSSAGWHSHIDNIVLPGQQGKQYVDCLA